MKTETWTKESIEQLITNQVEENIHLDYKAANSLQDKNEIAKDVAAFANSDGGVIIYGIHEFKEREKRYLPEKIDPIIDIKKHSKEWLEQVINSNIEPRISGIKITPIRLNRENTQTVYVVEIPKSNTVHMTNFRYYRRFNFESVTMHDYEIKDILNRKSNPKIQISFMISSLTMFNLTSYSVRVFAKNEGGVMAKYLKVYLYAPTKFVENNKLLVYTSTVRNKADCNLFEFDNRLRFESTTYQPILPGMKIELGQFPCVPIESINNIHLYTIVHVDNVQPIEAKYKLINSDFKQIE